MTSVYWIAHKDHSDIFSQGYVGVSNNVKSRWNTHKSLKTNVHLKNAITKYGWNNLVKKVVLIGEEDYCLEIENKLRPADKIGWNLVCGGGKPPVTLWNKGRKVPQNELAKLQANGFGFKKGHNTWNAGVKLTPEQKAKQFNLQEYMKDKPRFFAGKSMPRHIIEAARQANIGKIQTDESNQKRSLANKGRKFSLVTCPNCSKTGGLTSMKRWHFDNCKFKEIQA